jgi:hypothetical protein
VKRLCALISLVLVSSGFCSAAEPTVVGLTSGGGTAVFDFGPAQYFRALASQENCPVSFGDRFEALNSREFAAAAKLGQRYGAQFFDISKPVTPLPQVAQGTCSEPTLTGWEDKIVRLEHEASDFGPPSATFFGLTPRDCLDEAKVQAAYRAGLAMLRKGDRPASEANLDALNSVCGEASAVWPFRTLRASMALDDGVYDQALTLLKPVSIHASGPVAVVAAWLRLRLYEIKQDQTAFDAERKAMLAAVDHALGDPRGHLAGRRLDRFSVGSTKVSAYQTTIQQGPFERRMEFIIAPSGPFAEPESITLTHDSNSARIAAELSASTGKPVAPPIFVDRYNCQAQALLKTLQADIDYAAAKAIVVAELKSRPLFDQGKTAELEACHWPQFVTPGLGS